MQYFGRDAIDSSRLFQSDPVQVLSHFIHTHRREIKLPHWRSNICPDCLNTWMAFWRKADLVISNFFGNVYKKELNFSHIFVVSVMSFEFSEIVILSSFIQPLFVKKGRMVGQMSLDFSPHRTFQKNII